MRTYPVEIAGVRRELPIVQVGPGVAVALLNLLGDTELTEAAAEALAKRLPPEVEVLVTPEVKAVPLAHALSRITGKPYVVARKTEKPYMINPVSRQVLSIAPASGAGRGRHPPGSGQEGGHRGRRGVHRLHPGGAEGAH